MPVTSYAPEFLIFYQRASQRTVVIKLKTSKEAHKLRSRLHALRRSMQKEDHPLTTIANGVIISKKGATLTAKPADKEFLGYLKAAGITIGKLDNTIANEPTPSEKDQVDEQLSEFFRGENKT